MKRIKLTQGKHALVDDCDFNRLSQYNWTAGKNGHNWYAFRKMYVDGKQKIVLMHRTILGLRSTKRLSDHINGNGLDNQRRNLRVVTHLQNLQNQHSHINKTGFKGIYQQPWGTYKAQIQHKGKLIYLGSFDTPEQAAEAYDKMAKRLFGSYAHLNRGIRY